MHRRPLIAAALHERNQRVKADDVTRSDGNRGVIPISRGIFYGGDQPDLPGVPAPTAACSQCGSTFEISRRRKGRPGKFCSDDCRVAAVRKLKAEWYSAHAADEAGRGVIFCQICGSDFQPPIATSGRLPRFCGADCRQEYTRRLQGRVRARRRRRKAGFLPDH